MKRASDWTIVQLTTMMHEILAQGLLPMAEQLTVEANLFDAGLDSMAVAQLLLEIEARTGIWLEEALLTPDNLSTCKALARCVHGAMASEDARP